MSEPTVLYEWTFPPDRGCRIIEIEPGIVIGQERESHDAPWRDEPCPSGWKHELIALAQETSDWRSDAAMAVLETCGDEEHCTCVGPLRKLARDLGMDKAALVLTLEVETDLRRKAENDLAHEKARHAREQTEFIGAALYEFGVSGDDAEPGEAPGNFLLRLIRERKALHAREIHRARLEAKIEALEAVKGYGETWPSPYEDSEPSEDIVPVSDIDKVQNAYRAALAALEEK